MPLIALISGQESIYENSNASDGFKHIATRPNCGNILKPYKGVPNAGRESGVAETNTQVRSQSPGYMDDPQPSLFHKNRKVQRLNGFGSEKA